MANHPNRSKFSTTAPQFTAAQVRAARLDANLSTMRAAELIYRKPGLWEAWESGAQKVDPALFELFVIKAQAVRDISIGFEIGHSQRDPVGLFHDEEWKDYFRG